MKILDLYCGVGVGAVGYLNYGSVTGIDITDYSSIYPGTHFRMQDAITLDYEYLEKFDFIHASPPCQAYSKITPKKARSKHVKLVAATHLLCAAAHKPYVIENVEGSTHELRPNLILHGNYFGLKIAKKRFFHCSFLDRLLILGSDNADTGIMQISNRKKAIELYGLPNDFRGNIKQIRQGIPPCYTDFIMGLYHASLQ